MFKIFNLVLKCYFMSENKLILKDEYTYKDILTAYLDCRRSKRNSAAAIEFEVNYEKNLLDMLYQINNNEYELGRFTVFTVTKPKPREIWAPCFKDRILHHLIYLSIGKYYESRFIEDTFSCIPNRGTYWASKRVEELVKRLSQNFSKKVFVLQMDVANFFVSIDKNILWNIIKKTVGTTSLTAKLIHQNIFCNPTINPIIQPSSDFSIIEPHKSLWNAEHNKGLPIGVLTSQFFSNVYMDPADKIAKHTLHIKNYVRYVDDIIVLSLDKDELYDISNKYNEFLKTTLNLHLHPNKILIYPLEKGIDFVGRVIFPWRTTTRQRVISSAKSSFNELVYNRFSERFWASAQSYLGFMSHDNSFQIRKQLSNSVKLETCIIPNKNYTKLYKLY